jgi:Ca2+-binding EF-hand superfamily protein
MITELKTDTCIIGKIPNLTGDQIQHLFDEWDTNDDGKISWIEFREGMNRWKWRLTSTVELDTNIEHFFKGAHKMKMQGNI